MDGIRNRGIEMERMGQNRSGFGRAAEAANSGKGRGSPRAGGLGPRKSTDRDSAEKHAISYYHVPFVRVGCYLFFFFVLIQIQNRICQDSSDTAQRL